MSKMLQCRDIDDLMMEFLYHELADPAERDFRQHLDGCTRCGAELESLQRTREAMRSLPVFAPSLDVTSRLLQEAARRAPAVGVARATEPPRAHDDRRGFFGWMADFFRPLMAHPAWAAAASLILVAGVAGYLAMTGKVKESSHESEYRGPAVVSEAPAPAEATRGVARDEQAPLGDRLAPADLPVQVPAGGTATAGEAKPDPEFEGTLNGRTVTLEEKSRLDETKNQGQKAGTGQNWSRSKDQNVFADGDDIIDARIPATESGKKAKIERAESADKAPEPAPMPPLESARREKKVDELAPTNEVQVQGGVVLSTPPPPSVTGTTSGPYAAPVTPMASPRPVVQPPAVATPKPTAAQPAKQLSKEAEATYKQRKTLVESMHNEARQKASGGKCDDALALRTRIQRTDEGYFKRTVMGDNVINRCLPARRQSQPAPKAPAPSPDDAEMLDSEATH
jgi:hypothetical protein